MRPGSGEMFDRVAGRYDLLNRILSFGLDRGWRRRALAALELGDGARVLDLACGTGDLTLALARGGARVVGVDPSRGMLATGRAKLARGDVPAALTLGEAEALPFPDGSFDAVTMAFGIRNVQSRPRALAELRRVTRPEGRVAILELSDPRPGPLGSLARFYLQRVVPRVGAILSGAPEYLYLRDSVLAFPEPAAFILELEAAGLALLAHQPLGPGGCHLYLTTPLQA